MKPLFFLVLINSALATPSLKVNNMSKALALDQNEQIGNQDIKVKQFTLSWNLNLTSNLTSFTYIANITQLNLGSNPYFYIAFAFSKDQYMVRIFLHIKKIIIHD
jgi:hypothetical protein